MFIVETEMLRAPRSSPQYQAENVERRARVTASEYERFVGYAVLGQRFESGHVLALRRWPASSIGPAYTSIWHQLPTGTWRMYSNAPAEQSCARYTDSAMHDLVQAPIRLTWTDPYRLQIDLRNVGLEWEIDFRRSWMTSAFNASRLVLPDAALAAKPALRALERMAGWLKVGTILLTGVMPNGQQYRVLPRRLWLMEDSRAWLHGASLGLPQRDGENARFGTLSVPTSGALAFMSARFTPAGLR